MSLVEKMRRAREQQVTIGGHKLTIRRPTDLQLTEVAKDGGLHLRNVAPFVVGWDLTEQDLVPGGTAEPAPFDEEAFVEWIGDQPSVWGDLMGSFSKMITAHRKKMEGSSGN